MDFLCYNISMVPTWREVIATFFPVVTATLFRPPQAARTAGFLAPVPGVELTTFFNIRSTRNLLPQSAARPRSSEGSRAYKTCMNTGLYSADVDEGGAIATTVEPDGNTKYISDANSNRHTGGASDSPCDRREVQLSDKSCSSGGNGQWQGRRLFTLPPLILAATTACPQASSAAVTGGRIGGGYTPPPERAPSAPPMEQQQRYQAPQQQEQQYQPRAGRDIYGSEGSRFHIKFDSAQGPRRSTRRFDPDAGSVPSSTITPGDVVMVGGVSAGIAAVQRYNRKRFLEENGQDDSSPTLPARAGRKGGNKQEAVVTSLQLSLYCDRNGGQGDLLATLDKLSQTSDVNSPRGLSALISEVCLALLRSDRDWIGGTGGVKTYLPNVRSNNRGKKPSPASRAKRDFNRATMRERSKWEREAVSNTPDRGFSSSSAPSWGGSNAQKGGTYVVVTLLVAWSGLRSTPPQAEPRKGAWFWQDGGSRNDDQDLGFSVVNRASALTLLEWLGDEAAEGRGENVEDVEVLWTPADHDDSLDRDELDAKWPELRVL